MTLSVLDKTPLAFRATQAVSLSDECLANVALMDSDDYDDGPEILTACGNETDVPIVDLCEAGKSDECDDVDEIVAYKSCEVKATVTYTFNFLSNCTDDEKISYADSKGYPSDGVMTLEVLDFLMCPGTNRTISHVCNVTIPDGTGSAGGNTTGTSGNTPSPAPEADDDEDSAAGLIAFAGVSLAAAAMLA